MTDRLAGRTVFITAVGDLPGDALVRGFASEGANVAVNHLKLEVAERSAELARESGVEALACSAHLLDREAVRRAVDLVVERWGKLDILVANATWFLPNDPLASSDHEWGRIVERNLRAQIHAVGGWACRYICRLVASSLCRAQDRSEGQWSNTASPRPTPRLVLHLENASRARRSGTRARTPAPPWSRG
jgi:NAD(P)-dependent dehydrogenase (short-subunit alcohol dehydrogenase family)